MSTILQSEAWATFQRDLGHDVIQHTGDGYSYLAIVEGGRAGKYLYCPYGPVAESAQAFTRALDDLKRLAARKKCLFVRVEPASPEMFPKGVDPVDDLTSRGMFLAQRQIQPSHTWMVDLTQDEDALLQGMKSTNRNLHRNIHKKGVTFEESHDPADVAVLLKYLHQTAERVGFNRQQDAYLTQAAKSLFPLDAASVYLIRVEGEPIGAAMVYDSEDTRTYAHASMSFEHRRLSANNPLVSTMMLDAKAKGLKRFDMFGIAPDDEPDHPWAGFTGFKKSFGGYAVTTPGTWDLPVSLPAYRAFRAAYALRDKGLPRAKRLASRAVGAVRSLVTRS
ncbi:lipid II:glycine glycyltransferase FemX [Kocuria sp. HSID16901]|uniref:lipid II:glycine glycyltransferase FemX n=1 Tax=Kocuria sp. HSID16901 TaxID=2419505 RepID=UPI00066067B2|nr:peptidoglycan bridge formation glycyltransferase FemA/FemB family protein [Kocuria sp. HSID16901]RUQ21234.1 peptidoglycan bridge formation glycyltransferase FemA/FemB family protein [Kocuria sp. HSID16901]